MTKLEKLLAQLCPDGVEYKRLGDCCYLQKGVTPIQKAVPGEYPLVVTTDERKSSNTYQFDAPTVCIPLISSRGHGVACLNQVYYQEGKFALGNILCGVTPKVDSGLSAKFLYYYLNYKKDTLIVPLMKGGANVSLTVDALKRVKVVVPPLVVQVEVTCILDKFMALSTELKAELTARKKQYEYYRERLLDKTGEKAKIVSIAELGKWSGGKTPSMAEKSYWDNGTIPWISSKDMKTSTLSDTQDHITEKAVRDASMAVYPANSIAIVTRSGILKHTFPVAYVPFETTINQDIKMLVVNKDVLPRYAFHVIQGKGKDILAKTKKQGGTVDSLDFQKVLAYKVPLPPLDAQERLVKVLDNFDAICSDLTFGLPAQIEARQKQYEHYRDKLLSFREVIA